MNIPLRAYLRAALSVPPHVALGKAGRLAARRLRWATERARDRRRPTYLPPAAGHLAPLLDLAPEALPAGLEEALRPVVAHALAHEVDVLGSGWLRVAYGMACPGFEGIRCAAGPAVVADGGGAWLVDRVSPSNLARAQALWRLVGADYTPIDWHIDIRSGYRWDPLVHFRDIRFAAHPGADVKVPWEIGRLQHLPQLALACVLAAAGRWDAAESARCAAEVRNQILDFLATAPPRFGVPWACPMDVAIRAVNMALAVDLLRIAGVPLDAAFVSAVATALREHGRHVLANLEWHAGPRTNHYLADIAGIAFCGAALEDAEGDAWLAFAADQLDVEILAQFLPDGGCFEGSTLYHRLSADLVLFPLALLLAARDRRPAAFRAGATDRLKVRPPLHGRSPGPAAAERVARLVAFAAATARPDGRAPQIGDTDSGRLVKPHPTALPEGGAWREDALDIRPTLAAGHALLGTAAEPFADGVLIQALAQGRTIGSRVNGPVVAASAFGAEEEVAAMAARIARLPEPQRRETVIDLPGMRPETLVASAFPVFGLYVLRSADTYVALRCAALDDRHEWGHTHDDNLHLEVWHDGREYVTDPGSYLYTCAPRQRDLYRSAAAHFAPRPSGAAAVRFFAPFGADHLARGICVAFGPSGMAARLEGPGWVVWRAVRVEAGRLIVHDGAPDRPLSAVSYEDGTVTVSEGYGRQTARPVRSF